MVNRKASARDRRVVVVGSGLGGLAAGAFLSRDGYNVTVLEQHDKLGGYATSFRQGAFDFEVSLHALPLGRNSMHRMLSSLGVLDELEFVHLPELYRVVTPTHDLTLPNRDPEGFIQVLSSEFPGEAPGIRRFVQRMVAVAGDAERLSSRSDRFYRLLFPFQYRNMWKMRGLSLADLMDRYLTDPDLRTFASVLWHYYGLPPSMLSGFYFAVGTGDYIANGGAYPRGRSRDLSSALVRIIRDSGGKVTLNTPVERIRLNSRHAVGVDDARGRSHDADLVVSNASARVTFDRLVEPGAPHDPRVRRKLRKYRRKLSRYRPSLSSFIVWLGLDQDITDRIREAEIFLMPDHDPEAQYRACLRGDPENVTLAVTVYDNIFRGYSPPGKSTMMIVFLCSHDAWKPYEHGYGNGDREAYRQRKQEVAETLVDRVEEALLPGLWDMIEEFDAATPLTNVRFTGNCSGAIYGFEQALNNTFINRLDNRTPIPNLYLASAWSSPGGGFAGALRSGQRTWRAIRKDFRT